MAGKEYQIEVSLDSMLDAWKDVFFDVFSYRETGTFIIRKTGMTLCRLWLVCVLDLLTNIHDVDCGWFVSSIS